MVKTATPTFCIFTNSSCSAAMAVPALRVATGLFKSGSFLTHSIDFVLGIERHDAMHLVIKCTISIAAMNYIHN